MPSKQLAHVVDRVDGDTGHPNITGNARVVGIVAPMGRQIEGHGQPFLARRQVAPVEGVGLLRRREAGILPDSPGPGRVHGRIRPAHIGRDPRPAAEKVEPLGILGGVERLDVDTLRRCPGPLLFRQRAKRFAPTAPVRGGIGLAIERDRGEIRYRAHGSIIPISPAIDFKLASMSSPAWMNRSIPEAR